MRGLSNPDTCARRSFLADERGAITTDMVVIFLPILILILTVFEIGISFYLVLAAQKAAQLGARYVVGEDPVHSAVPQVFGVNTAVGQLGDSCFVPTGGSALTGTSPCLLTSVPPVIGADATGAEIRGWVCDGRALDPACREPGFEALLEEMRIVYPNLTGDLVAVSYIYEEVGFAGGPFQPRVQVDIQARSSPIQILSLLDILWSAADATGETGGDATVGIDGFSDPSATELRRVSASVFAADMTSTNLRD